METIEKINQKIDPVVIDKVKEVLCVACKTKLISSMQNTGKFVMLNPNAFATGFFKSLCRKCKSNTLKVLKR